MALHQPCMCAHYHVQQSAAALCIESQILNRSRDDKDSIKSHGQEHQSAKVSWLYMEAFICIYMPKGTVHSNYNNIDWLIYWTILNLVLYIHALMHPYMYNCNLSFYYVICTTYKLIYNKNYSSSFAGLVKFANYILYIIIVCYVLYNLMSCALKV